MREIVLIAHNVRSAHNVGSLLRTADGLGVKKIYLTGYTPYPSSKDDDRLPHIAAKVDRQIAKTALEAQNYVDWQHRELLSPLVGELKRADYEIAALEQAVGAIKLSEYRPPTKVALLIGSEVGGLDKQTLDQTDVVLEIPMHGRKESFNVAVAAGMALFYLTATPLSG